MRNLLILTALLAASSALADDCAMAGYAPGMVTHHLELTDRDQFRAARPKVHNSGALASYEIPLDQSMYRQYILIDRGEIVEVVREYQPGLTARVLADLARRYGEPASGSVGWPTGGVIWRDTICGHSIRAYSQERSRLAAMVGAGDSRLVVVLSLLEHGQADLID